MTNSRKSRSSAISSIPTGTTESARGPGHQVNVLRRLRPRSALAWGSYTGLAWSSRPTRRSATTVSFCTASPLASEAVQALTVATRPNSATASSSAPTPSCSVPSPSATMPRLALERLCCRTYPLAGLQSATLLAFCHPRPSVSQPPSAAARAVLNDGRWRDQAIAPLHPANRTHPPEWAYPFPSRLTAPRSPTGVQRRLAATGHGSGASLGRGR